MKLRIKIVPDSEPNADGTWQEIDMDAEPLPLPRKMKDVWDVLNSRAPAGYHVVSYEFASQ